MSADDELRRVVTGPEGHRYEISAVQQEWKLGTGSIVLDFAAFLWGLVRRARRADWVVSVKRPGSKLDAVASRKARSKEEAVSVADQLARALETGDLP